jgi:hypothetical protein
MTPLYGLLRRVELSGGTSAQSLDRATTAAAVGLANLAVNAYLVYQSSAEALDRSLLVEDLRQAVADVEAAMTKYKDVLASWIPEAASEFSSIQAAQNQIVTRIQSRRLQSESPPVCKRGLGRRRHVRPSGEPRTRHRASHAITAPTDPWYFPARPPGPLPHRC